MTVAVAPRALRCANQAELLTILSQPTFSRLRQFSSITRRLDRRKDDSSQDPSSPTSSPPFSSSESSTPPPSVSNLLASAKPEDNNLLAPVHIPEDPDAVIKSRHPATSILSQSGLVVQRQIEMMNLFLGFEQANRYVIMDPHGETVGFMAEHDGGFGKIMGRQWFKTHRAFTTHVFDKHQREVLRFHRPFSWINSSIRVYDPIEADTPHIPPSPPLDMQTTDPKAMRQISQLPLDAMRVIGETHSEWAPLRRKYDLFLGHDPSSVKSPSQSSSQSHPSTHFASINEPFLSWDFSLLSTNGKLVGSVNRNFVGFGRELFTDMGTYALRMDSAGLEQETEKNATESASTELVRNVAGMTLDQRAVMLATAVTVDFDYFSRHSRHGSGMFLPMMWGGGGEAAGGATGGAAGGAVGGAGEAAGGAVIGTAGRAAGGVAGAGEGAIAGAGTMAGYEAMQRGMGRRNEGDQQTAAPDQGYAEQAPTQEQSYGEQQPYEGFQDPQSQPPQSSEGGDIWGGENDPWSGGSTSGDGGGSEGGGGWISSLWDSFFGD